MTAGHLWTAIAIVGALTQGHGEHAQHGMPAEPVVRTEDGWIRYEHKTGGFSLEHPPDWRVGRTKGVLSIQISHPSKPAHIFAAAFQMPEGSLQEFAVQRFAVQSELFNVVGPPRPVEGPGWTGLMQDADTSEGGQHARRRILCARHDAGYVSLTLYVDPKELAEHEPEYARLFSSLRFSELPKQP